MNTFELKDAAGASVVFVRAADLMQRRGRRGLTAAGCRRAGDLEGPGAAAGARGSTTSSAGCRWRKKCSRLRNDAPAIPRLGVPAYDYWNECLHGVARAGVATVFPQAIGMAATWDTPLIHQEADVIATEARAKHNEYVQTHDGDSAQYYGLTFWTPNINIFRDPRWGRGQETYGEDPFLTGAHGRGVHPRACRATIRNTSRPWLAPNILPCTAARNRSATALTPIRRSAIFTKPICRISKPRCAKATSAG